MQEEFIRRKKIVGEWNAGGVVRYLGDDLERHLRLGVPVLVRVQLQRCVRACVQTHGTK